VGCEDLRLGWGVVCWTLSWSAPAYQQLGLTPSTGQVAGYLIAAAAVAWPAQTRRQGRYCRHHTIMPSLPAMPCILTCLPTAIALACREHLGEWPGPIVEEESGEVIGYHRGFWFHTVGQRKGIPLSGGPW